MGMESVAKDGKAAEFLHIADLLNRQLQVTPLLYGSLGLEKRLETNLNADDIDVLVPDRLVGNDWPILTALMLEDGYCVFDEDEHEFRKADLCVAFAGIDGLQSFAGVDISGIPVEMENGICYLLLELPDYLKVYEASSKDGYRKTVKNKQDQDKIDRIREALGCS